MICLQWVHDILKPAYDINAQLDIKSGFSIQIPGWGGTRGGGLRLNGGGFTHDS